MADADEIVVEIEKEAPAETTTVEVKTDAGDPVADLKAQYEELKQASERDRVATDTARREAAAERQRREAAEKEVDSTRTEIAQTRLGTVEQGLAAAQTEAKAAKAEYISAQEAGDWARSADAQERMAAAQARITRLDEAKSDLEAAPVRKTEQRTEAPQTPADPVEAFLASRTEATRTWLRAHPEEARALAHGDERRSAKLNAAHSEAVAEGIKPDTPEYFTHVEKYLGFDKPLTNGKDKHPQRRAASAPVAPVQNSAGGMNGGGTTVKLSKNEAATAVDGTLTWNYDDPSGQKKFKKGDPIGIQEFARRKQAMKESGLYDKTYVEQ